MNVRRLWSVLGGAIVSAMLAAAQTAPAIRSIVNAASYVSSDRPHWGIAPGSLFVLTGYNLGPNALQSSAGFPLRTSLGDTSVEVTAGGSPYSAFMIYTSVNQAAAILPSATPIGDATVTITYQGRRSLSAPIRVVPANFGIFSRNQGGFGPGIIQNVASSTERPLNGLATPAQAGQLVTIWGTGLGAAPGDEAAGPVPSDLPAGVEVMAGGQPAKIVYRGRSGCCAGIDEIYFEVPPGIEGCRIPVAVKAGGILSNFVSMAVAGPSQVCPGAELPDALVERVARGEDTSVGRIELARFALQFASQGMTMSATTDVGHAHFTQYPAADLLSLEAAGSYWMAGTPAPGHCTVLPPDVYATWPLPAASDSAFRGANANHRLDAGSEFLVSGHSQQRTIYRYFTWYQSTLGGLDMANGGVTEPFLDPAEYTITGSGGTDVGAFSASLTLPPAVVWTNRDNIQTIPRNQDLTVTWNGSDPERQIVAVYALSQGDTQGNTAVAVCAASAAAGALTVPAWVLLELPASYLYEGVPLGVIGVLTAPVPGAEAEFSAPGIQYARTSYVLGDFKYVAFQ